MKNYIIEVFNENGLMRLIVVKGYKFYFTIKKENGFERDKTQVLAIMENQYKELGELIKIVKENY